MLLTALPRFGHIPIESQADESHETV
jgi:hypothetical protein